MNATQSMSATIDRLKNILAEEREMLLAGMAHEAAGLVSEKMAALEAFDAMLGPGSAAAYQRDIEAVIGMAKENAAHFSAVRNGLASAISRLGNLSDDSYVGAYGQGGQRTAFTKASGGYLKKA